MYPNLRTFLDALRKEKELAVIDVPVSPDLEIAEIHRRVIEEGGPALLFRRVEGSPFPVVTNLFGTPKRVEMAFGPRPEQLMKRIVSAMHTLLPPTPKALWRERDLLWQIAKVGTRTVPARRAPVLEVCDKEAPLAGLPALTSWPDDGGPFITLPLVYTEHPRTGQHNLGMYRMQIFDGQTTGMHWQIHKGGGFHYHEAESAGQALPVTVFLGGPPALIASAIAPVPEQLPELMITSLILGDKLPVTPDPIGRHRLVAEAEFAIHGVVPPFERRPEGPFGDHYGYYSLQHDFPVFRVSHVWRRKDAIYPATVVGEPRQEDYYLGEFLQRLLSPAFPMAMPGVRDLWTYGETGFHSLAAAVVRESYERESLSTAFRILGEGQLTLTKFLIVTDRPVDLSKASVLLETVLERFDPERDVFVFNHTSHDTLDYTGGRLNHGSKAVLIGTGDPKRTLAGEYTGGPLPGIDRIRPFCRGCLAVSGAAYEADPELAARLLSSRDSFAGWPLVFVVDDADVAESQASFLWSVFTRFNPATDMYADGKIANHHFGYQLPIIVDARMKPGYPGRLVPREDVRDKVSARWKQYFA